MERKIVAVMTGLALVLIAAMAGAQGDENLKSQTVQRAAFQVKNLSCGGCLAKINSSLIPEEGFSGMGANLLRGMVAVDFTTPLTPDKIQAVISGLGYPASLESVDSITEKQTFAYLRSLRQGRGAGGNCCGREVTAQAQCPGGGTGCQISGGAVRTDTGKDI